MSKERLMRNDVLLAWQAAREANGRYEALVMKFNALVKVATSLVMWYGGEEGVVIVPEQLVDEIEPRSCYINCNKVERDVEGAPMNMIEMTVVKLEKPIEKPPCNCGAADGDPHSDVCSYWNSLKTKPLVGEQVATDQYICPIHKLICVNQGCPKCAEDADGLTMCKCGHLKQTHLCRSEVCKVEECECRAFEAKVNERRATAKKQ